MKMSCSRSNMDIISNLPSNVLDEILSRMPIIDAGRTSVLSRKWRYIWASIPHIVFDNDSVSISSQEDRKTIGNKFINIVDQVLLLHDAPINKFRLSCRYLKGEDIGDRWILNISRRNSIKEFILDIWRGHPYKIPTCLFSCEGLIHLELSHCLMKPPSTFKGFKNLKSLDLQFVTLGQDKFENLIRSCPLMERLTLKKIKGVTHFNIDAPNLKSIKLLGNVENGQTLDPSKHSNKLLSFFDHLPHIQRLEFLFDSLDYFSDVVVPDRLPLSTEVNYLFVDINLDNLNQSLLAFCLLRSCPNIQNLIVEVEVPSEETCINFWNKGENRTPMFPELRLVKIENITGTRSEMDFIKIILSNSMVLKKMILKFISVPDDRRWESMKQLLRYPRASTVAEIIYLDP